MSISTAVNIRAGPSRPLELEFLLPTVQSFNTSTTKYSVGINGNWIASHGVVEIIPACLFQNVAVRLRDLTLVQKLGSHSSGPARTGERQRATYYTAS